MKLSAVPGSSADKCCSVDGNIGDPFKPQTGTQFEAGMKWQPGPGTLVTVTAFRVNERNRVLYGEGSSTTQAGELTTKGIEFEASHTLPGDFDLLVNYGYNKLRSETNTDLDYLPRHIASVWSTKAFGLVDEAQLRLGVGVVYTGKRRSTGPAWSLTTPSNTTVDSPRSTGTTGVSRSMQRTC
jgi:iron complex outermembrane receptor protein